MDTACRNDAFAIAPKKRRLWAKKPAATEGKIV